MRSSPRSGFWLMLVSLLAAGLLVFATGAAGLPAAQAGGLTATPATPTPTATPAGFDVRAETSTSPDGQWLAVSVVMTPRAGELYYTQLRVSRRDGGQAWTAVDAWAPFGLGYTTPQALQWSRDGRALYYTHRPVLDGCALFANGSDLWRLDLATGQSRQLAPDLSLWLALSPDEKTLAYIDNGLRLRDLATGRERRLTLDNIAPAAGREVGNLVWAPDGKRLLLTIAYDACQPDTWVHSIALADLTTGTVTVLVAKDPRQFRVAAWVGPERVRLLDPAGQRWYLDLETGEVTRPR